MLADFVKFAAVGIFIAQDTARKFNYSNLHSKADAEIRHFVGSCITARTDHAFNSAVTKAARKNYARTVCKNLRRGFVSYFVAVNPFDFYVFAHNKACMVQRFNNTKIRIVKLYVFAYKRNLNFALACMNHLNHPRPFSKRRVVCSLFNAQIAAHNVVHVLGVQHERHFVKALAGCVVDYAVFADVAEKRNLFADIVRNNLVTACNYNVRVNSDSHQLFYRMLCRFALEFIAARNIRHKADVNKQAVPPSYFNCKLAYCLKKGLAFNVTDCAAYFDNAYVCL